MMGQIRRAPKVQIVDADVNPADWSQTDPAEILRRTLEAPCLGAGSIIDLHDGAETENDGVRLSRPLPTIEALPKLMDELKARGFALIGLDEMELIEPKTWPEFSREVNL